MIANLEILQPSPLENLTRHELRVNTRRVLDGHLPGFVIAASMNNAFAESVACASDLGLVGGDQHDYDL